MNLSHFSNGVYNTRPFHKLPSWNHHFSVSKSVFLFLDAPNKNGPNLPDFYCFPLALTYNGLFYNVSLDDNSRKFLLFFKFDNFTIFYVVPITFQLVAHKWAMSLFCWVIHEFCVLVGGRCYKYTSRIPPNKCL